MYVNLLCKIKYDLADRVVNLLELAIKYNKYQNIFNTMEWNMGCLEEINNYINDEVFLPGATYGRR